MMIYVLLVIRYHHYYSWYVFKMLFRQLSSIPPERRAYPGWRIGINYVEVVHRILTNKAGCILRTS